MLLQDGQWEDILAHEGMFLTKANMFRTIKKNVLTKDGISTEERKRMYWIKEFTGIIPKTSSPNYKLWSQTKQE